MTLHGEVLTIHLPLISGHSSASNSSENAKSHLGIRHTTHSVDTVTLNTELVWLCVVIADIWVLASALAVSSLSVSSASQSIINVVFNGLRWNCAW